MNESQSTRHEQQPKRAVRVLASDGWHRFVTVVCLVGSIVMCLGVLQLLGPPDGRPDHRTFIDYICGVGFLVLGLLSCRYLVRQFRTSKEDLEDRRELAAAKRRNAGKPGTTFRQAAKELGL